MIKAKAEKMLAKWITKIYEQAFARLKMLRMNGHSIDNILDMNEDAETFYNHIHELETLEE